MRMIGVLFFLLFGLHFPHLMANAASESSGTDKAGSKQGLTLDELGRGLKSAAKNIEEEIPKIGPAIGKTFKQVTGGEKGPDRSRQSSTSQSSSTSKK